ncbi:MAG: DUF692 domain-containing protein [Actinomycetota bacterium]|nr:DUF692 domain-containing protein [Actinomycetota bacterium]
MPPIAPRSNLDAPAIRPADAPALGVGIGLRVPHYGEVLERARASDLDVDFLEIISENFMVAGGRPRRILDDIRAERPVVMHGVSMNLGSTDPLDAGYLDRLDELASRIEPGWLSDHLCWTGVGGAHLHDLLPLPSSEPVLAWVAERIERVQERLGRRIAIENVSSYLSFVDDELDEWQFLAELAERADCGVLLDVNNVFVSAHNHGFDAEAYLDSIPAERIFQIHLAGHSESGPLLIDTHDHPVRDEVWRLYERVVRRTGPVSTLIEWDEHLPTLDRLVEEASRARRILEDVGAEVAA